MDRAAAVEYLEESYGDIRAYVGRTADDTAGGYKPAIDAAFRALGVPRASLATATTAADQDGALEALLTYHVLDLFRRKLATRPDVTAGDGKVQAKRKQIFDMVTDLYNQAAAAVAAMASAAGGAGTYRLTTLDTGAFMSGSALDLS